MIRLALPKGRNLQPTVTALRRAGLKLSELDAKDRKLLFEAKGDGFEVLLLKDADLPLYVQYGIADVGIIGTDVLEEFEGDLLMPVRFVEGGCRLSFIGPEGALPRAGGQIRLATKFSNIARRVIAQKPWGAEIVKLSGSIELAPLLKMADMALDIVQTGRTLKENHLHELEVVREVSPCLILNRAAYQRHRRPLNDLIGSLEAAGVAQ